MFSKKKTKRRQPETSMLHHFTKKKRTSTTTENDVPSFRPKQFGWFQSPWQKTFCRRLLAKGFPLKVFSQTFFHFVPKSETSTIARPGTGVFFEILNLALKSCFVSNIAHDIVGFCVGKKMIMFHDFFQKLARAARGSSSRKQLARAAHESSSRKQLARAGRENSSREQLARATRESSS